MGIYNIRNYGITLSLLVAFQVGCSAERPQVMTSPSTSNGSQGAGGIVPTPRPTPTPVSSYKAEPLSWEATRSEGKVWSEYVFKVIREEAFTDLDKAIDVEIFCPNYDNLSKDQRINFWGGLVSGITKFESGYSPTMRYQESTMGRDPITGNPVYSEGLLQLSYQDVQWATYCEFNWAVDKKLSSKDAKKTIFDPKKNLRCGIKILADQVRRKKEILLQSGVYWAVIREGGSYEKIDQIAAITKKLTFCKK